MVDVSQKSHFSRGVGGLRRREFLQLLTTIGVSFPNPLSNANQDTNEEPTAANPLDLAYLQQGLNALARAHQLSSMAGHLGAAMIAGYFVAAQLPKLDQVVYQGIEDDLQRVVRGESVFGKKMSKDSPFADSELFLPFPEQPADATLIDGIADALKQGIDQTRQSGHNVIFASLAIRALNEHPEFATPNVVDGIIKLIKMFRNETPGSGYYGKQQGRIHGNKINLPADDGTPEYRDIQGMTDAVLDELLQLRSDRHRIGYGSLVHIINHAAAITNLPKFGYADLVPRAIKSHRQHLRLWRNLPNVADEKGPMLVSKFTPDNASYWNSGDVPYDRALLTHRVKTMFGFHEVSVAANHGTKRQAHSQLRYLM